jgi:uncharacterized OsmC-like protein
MARVTTYYKGDMLFDTKLGDHTLTSDVPATMGGKNRAPTPPEIFVASLGSCVAALVADYCGRVGIDFRDLAVDVTYDKLDEPTRLANLRVKIHLPRGGYGAREPAILRVADHCPVAETIATVEGIEVEVTERPVEPANS